MTSKPTDTTDLLTRYVFTDEEVESSLRPPGQRRPNRPEGGPNIDQQAGMEGARQSALEVRSRSVTWVVGTSLLFDAVLVGLAGWIFRRRDY